MKELISTYDLISRGNIELAGVHIRRFDRIGIKPLMEIDRGRYYLSGTLQYFLSIDSFEFKNKRDIYSALIGWREFVINHKDYDALVLPAYLQDIEEHIKEARISAFGKED